MILNSIQDVQQKPKSIVSLVPSQTELLWYLGLEKEVTGITKFCVHPAEWFATKKRIGGTKQLHIDEIINLCPNLIIANKEENTKEQIETLAETYNVLVTDVNNLQEALSMIKEIGEITGKLNESTRLTQEIEQKFEQLNRENIKLEKAAYLIWQEPYMTVGGDTFINNMMKHAGYENVFASLQRYPELTIELIKDSGCSTLLLSSEPYPFKEKHVSALQKYLPGIKIKLVDGEMFSWYGSRLLKAPDYFKQLQKEES